MNNCSYVLVTPVRNEETTIGVTIESVVQQTICPIEWVIVSDESTDRTDDIIRNYVTRFPFIRHLRLTRRPNRNFASVVFATKAGIAHMATKNYSYIGLLDADIKFDKMYYEEIMKRFAADSRLGLAGGIVIDLIEGRRRRSVQSMQDVAGAVQFFRRECFEALGGLIAIPEGGWDALTCVQVRMQGYRTKTFSEIKVDHLKPRNIAEGRLAKRIWQLGVREYALGNHPIYELGKVVYRTIEYPYLIGSLIRWAGYLWCLVHRKPRLIPKHVLDYLRREQLARIRLANPPSLLYNE